MKKRKVPKMSLYITEELLKQFKLACVENGITMSEVLISAIKDYLKTQEKAAE